MGINREDFDRAIEDVLPKMMIFKRDVFRPMRELRTFCHFDTAAIVFKDSAMNFWFELWEREYLTYFFDQIHERKNFSHGM